MDDNLTARLDAAVRSGALCRYEADLDHGQMALRCIWIAPEPKQIIASDKLGGQRYIIRAALNRFILGSPPFTVITAAVDQRTVEVDGDMRELKGGGPNFVEFRFRPPKHDVRLFGTFTGADQIVITGIGMKSLSGGTGRRPLSVPEQRQRADALFQRCGLDRNKAPSDIKLCIPDARFVER